MSVRRGGGALVQKSGTWRLEGVVTGWGGAVWFSVREGGIA